MLSDLLNKMTDKPRESLLLAALAVVIGALLSSMYMVCAGQVRSAEAYHASVKVQRLAVLDCLATDPRASYSACASQVAMIVRQPAGLLQTAQAPMVQQSPGPLSALLTVGSSVMPVAYYTR